MTTACPPRSRAVFEATNPSMDGTWIADGRGDLLYPVVLWCKADNHDGWNRMSGVVELSVARRWSRTWTQGGKAIAITPAARISKTVLMPAL